MLWSGSSLPLQKCYQTPMDKENHTELDGRREHAQALQEWSRPSANGFHAPDRQREGSERLQPGNDVC